MDLTEKVRLATSGDREAFGDLVRMHERLVLGVAWNRLRDYQAAQDVAQEAFLIAYRQLSTLKEPAAFGAWISQIAFRCCRQTHVPSCLEKEKHANGPLESLIVNEEADRILTAIQTLPEHERTVVFLRYVDGYDVVRIAEITGRPIGTVTKQLSRSVQRLRSILVEVRQ